MYELVLSQTKISTFLSCRKKYYWKYIIGYHQKDKPKPLKIGSIVHICIDKYYKQEQITFDSIEKIIREEYPDLSDEQVNQLLDETTPLIFGYINTLGSDESVHVIASETWIEFPYRKNNSVLLQGKIDGICKMSGRLFRVERKTASNINMNTLNSYKYSTQETLYQYLTSCIYDKISGVLYELIVKTKTPKYIRFPILTLPSKITSMTEDLLDGLIDDMLSNKFYPSIQCKTYNRVCEYMPLCFENNPNIDELYVMSDQTNNQSKGGDSNEDVED